MCISLNVATSYEVFKYFCGRMKTVSYHAADPSMQFACPHWHMHASNEIRHVDSCLSIM